MLIVGGLVGADAGTARVASAGWRLGVAGLLAVALVIPLAGPAQAVERGEPAGASPRAEEGVPGLDLRSRRPSRAQLDELQRRAVADGSVPVVLGLRIDWTPEGELGALARGLQRAQTAQLQGRLRAELAGTGVRIKTEFDSIPFVAAELPPAAVDALRRSETVATIEIDDPDLAPSLADSVPLIDADVLHRQGLDGSGQTVAIIDSGVELDHPLFQGRIVAEACFTDGECADDTDEQVGVAGAGAPCTSVPHRCDHGTHVAGIAAGAADDHEMVGAAPGADIIAIQVFSMRTSCGTGPSPCIRADWNNLLSALQQVYEWRDDHAVAAVNLSLGGGRYDVACDDRIPSFAAAVANLRSVGIATVAASGNDGHESAMGAPACVRDVISVGNTTKADGVAGNSNSVGFLDLLAPGTNILSAVTGNGYAAKSGTSMASPHVAGAIAQLRHHDPDASVAEILAALKATGLRIADGKNDQVHPRIDVAAAATVLDDLCTADVRFEPGSSFEDAFPVPSRTNLGQILCHGDVHHYRFEIEDVPVALDVTLRYPEGVGVDRGRLELRVFGPGQDEELGRSQVGYGEEAVSADLDRAGTYFVRVSGFADTENSYDLAIDRSSCPPYLPPGYVTDTQRLAFDGTVEGLLCAGAGRDDRYQVELVAGEQIRAELTSSAADGATDLYLHDERGGLIASSVGHPPLAVIDEQVAEEGRYVLTVRGGPDAAPAVAYELLLRRQACPPDDGYAPNHSTDTGVELGHGARVIGIVCGSQSGPNARPDFFDVTDAPPGSTLTLDIRRRSFEVLPIQMNWLGGEWQAGFSTSEPIEGGTRLKIQVPEARAGTTSIHRSYQFKVHRGAVPAQALYERYLLDLDISICPGDDPDARDTVETATPLRQGGGVDAIICADSPDHYALEAFPGSPVSATLLHEPGEGLVAADILAPDGTVLASGIANHNGYLAIEATAQTLGEHYVRVRDGGWGDAAARYRLDADVGFCPPDDAFEPNNSPLAATPLTTDGDDYLDAVLCAGDRDYYRFDAAAGAEVDVDLRFHNPDGLAWENLDLEVLDASLEVVASSASTTSDEQVLFTAPSTGTYYVLVRGYQDGAENTYRLRVRTAPLCPGDDAFAPNHTVADAYDLGTGGQVAAVLCGASTPDHFAFHAFSGSDVTIDFIGSALLGTLPQDVEVDLFGPDGTQVASSTDEVPVCVPNPDGLGFICTGEPKGTPVRHMVADSGVHTVRVRTDQDGTRPYRLDVHAPICLPDDDQAPNHRIEDAFAVSDGDEIFGVLCEAVPGSGDPTQYPDRDVFAVEIDAGERLTAALHRDLVGGELDMVLLDPTGSQALVWAFDPDDEDVTLEYVASSAGTYFVVVRAEPFITNHYRLAFDIVDHVDLVPPQVTDVELSAPEIQLGESSILTATIDDLQTGGSVITGAEHRVGSAPWVPMTAVDGAFDSTFEAVTAELTPAEVGDLDVCVRASDAGGTTSEPVCVTLVVPDAQPPELEVSVEPLTVVAGGSVQVTAIADDRERGGSDIASVDRRIDGGGWSALDPDTVLTGPLVEVAAEVGFDVVGEHLLCIRTVDAAGSSSLPDCHTVVVTESAGEPDVPGPDDGWQALETVRVSVTSEGAEADHQSATYTVPSVSADGRFVAFDSAASNLVAGDTNATQDVFVHDRHTGVTERVSVASDGTQANGPSFQPSLSADGRYVAFDSRASNLTVGDTNGVGDVFVHDRETGVTERVSVATGGTEADNDSHSPSISADGDHVAFVSRATNLVIGDTNGLTDIFVHDRTTGVTERVSVASDGTQGDSNVSIYDIPSISADGRHVAFVSHASNLVTDDTNDAGDVFVHDRATGVTERVSVASNGQQSDRGTFTASLSADGRHVAFATAATNLVADDTNGVGDVFVHDRDTGVTERVSVAGDGTEADGPSPLEPGPSISGDGRYVAFVSGASNLVAGDDAGFQDVFVRDRQGGSTRRVSVASDGTQADGHSRAPAMSADGYHVAYASHATNLVHDDTNGHIDVFATGRATKAPDTPVLDRITVAPETVAVTVGDTQPFTATGTYSDTTTVDLTLQVAWASTNPEVASIGATGLVTTHADGDVMITASLDDVTGQASLTVTPVEIVDDQAPLVSNVMVDPNPVEENSEFAVTATIDDTTTGGSAIISAEYRIDQGAWQPMAAAGDNTFDQPHLEVIGVVTDGLPTGSYEVCVRGTDAANNLSAEACTQLEVTGVPEDPAPGPPADRGRPEDPGPPADRGRPQNPGRPG